jgi:Na+-transporting NADH:ubiquinone oxidoreductase subunit C
VQQSNGYIIGYTAGLTVVCALVLAFVSLLLKDRQDANVQREMKQNILSTVMTLDDKADVEALYTKRVKSYLVDANGDKVEKDASGAAIVVEKLPTSFVADEYKKSVNERKFPVYEIVNENDPNKTDYFVLPVYGYGLWNNISGYISLEGDLNTVKGVKFSHVGETPGLGARIADAEIQGRYAGKKLFEGPEMVAIMMQKGENGGGSASIAAFKDNPHAVDGMSGATITGKGVNNMLAEYFKQGYKNFLLNKKGGNKAASL